MRRTSQCKTQQLPCKAKKIAFLVTDGFEQVELTAPWEQIKLAGADTELVALEEGKVQGYNHLDKADAFGVDKAISDVSASDYDGLVLPGGVANPDALRTDSNAVHFLPNTSLLQQFVMHHGHW